MTGDHPPLRVEDAAAPREARRPRRRRRARQPRPGRGGRRVSDARRRVLDEHAQLLGDATNNVAEYRALLLGLRRARASSGADEVEVVNDSELIAKQVNGDYKVKHADMKPLHARGAGGARAASTRWSIRTVPRAQNADADALVNAALDGA